jgi:hypothetical protein
MPQTCDKVAKVPLFFLVIYHHFSYVKKKTWLPIQKENMVRNFLNHCKVPTNLWDGLENI